VKNKKVRYAVAGLGYISQSALLPAFKNAKNSELTALISSDEEKRREVAETYGLPEDATYTYEQYDQAMNSGKFDAVYIGLPNHMHCEYTLRAAKAGIHVLCEKPMALDEGECEQMIQICDEMAVRLMIAYRLHFEPANLEAIEIVSSGKLGDARFFRASFSQQVDDDNVRLKEPQSRGGGCLYDMGVYCVNASRYLLRDEPIEVTAVSANNGEQRFRGSPEMIVAVLRFPNEKLASFVTSFGAADTSEYSVAGTLGTLRVSPAFDYSIPLAHELTTADGPPKKKKFPKRDQFGPELVYFSDCILKEYEPEPSGWEGLADIRIVRAIIEAAETQRPVKLARFEKRSRPGKRQEITKPAVEQPELVNVSAPSGD